MRLAAVVFLVLVTIAVGAAWPAADGDIEVKVQVDGRVVRVAASLRVEAEPAETWAVMTDFERMADFISNLKSSRVLSRAGNTLIIAQAGEASFGPISYSFESTREIRLWPIEGVQSRMLSGTMERFEGVTRFMPEAGGTRILYQSESVPGKWIPPILGPKFVERETREQFSEFRAEILRRKQERARAIAVQPKAP